MRVSLCSINAVVGGVVVVVGRGVVVYGGDRVFLDLGLPTKIQSFTTSWGDEGAATYGALITWTVRLRGLGSDMRVRRPSPLLTSVVVYGVIVPRIETGLRIHVSGLWSTLEGQGLELLYRSNAYKNKYQSTIPGHLREWNGTEKYTAPPYARVSYYVLKRYGSLITFKFRYPVVLSSFTGFC